MSGWSRSGGGACFWLFSFCLVSFKKRPFAKLAWFGGCFLCFGAVWVGCTPPKNWNECQSGG